MAKVALKFVDYPYPVLELGDSLDSSIFDRKFTLTVEAVVTEVGAEPMLLDQTQFYLRLAFTSIEEAT